LSCSGCTHVLRVDVSQSTKKRKKLNEREESRPQKWVVSPQPKNSPHSTFLRGHPPTPPTHTHTAGDATTPRTYPFCVFVATRGGERKHCSPVTLFPRPCVCREGCAAERSQRARLHSLLGVKLPSPPSWHRPPPQRGWSQGLQRRCLAWARWRRAHPRASPVSTPTCLRRRRGRFFPTNTPTPLRVFHKAM
jgi:hypothetical protein